MRLKKLRPLRSSLETRLSLRRWMDCCFVLPCSGRCYKRSVPGHLTDSELRSSSAALVSAFLPAARSLSSAFDTSTRNTQALLFCTAYIAEASDARSRPRASTSIHRKFLASPFARPSLAPLQLPSCLCLQQCSAAYSPTTLFRRRLPWRAGAPAKPLPFRHSSSASSLFPTSP